MSVGSFLARAGRDPGYVGRRLRWELWKRAPERKVLVNSRHGKIAFSTRDQIIGRALYLTGEFAFGEIETACRLFVERGFLRPTENRVLLDIGANIGTTCIPLVARGNFAAAIAFEPDARNFGLLRENLERNGVKDRIEAVPCALSAAEGRGEMQLSPDNFGDHRLRVGPSGAGGVETELRSGSREVEITTLDRALGKAGLDPEAIDLIWMDTQGHEPLILKGARETLGKKRIPLLMEFWPEGMRAAGETIDSLCAELSRYYAAFTDTHEPGMIPRSLHQLPDLARKLARGAGYTDIALYPA